MNRQEILKEIDTTLDQLIKNASALQEVADDPLYKIEVEALHKTQESLLAHLLHLHSLEISVGHSLISKFELFSELSPALRKKFLSLSLKPLELKKQKSLFNISMLDRVLEKETFSVVRFNRPLSKLALLVKIEDF